MANKDKELKERAAAATIALKKEYPDALCSLEADSPLRLLIATRLSAQCTDARVNVITPLLFERFPELDDLADADIEEVEKIVKPCGFYRQKAADIVNTCKKIRQDHAGRVPDTMEDLTSLPGVGRKTANLILGDVYGKPAVVADTHLIRISNLLGLVDTKDPYKVEMRLRELLDPKESNDFCHRCVLHGRAVCVARRPKCKECCLKDICPSSTEKEEQNG